jgi:hypothetical protein
LLTWHLAGRFVGFIAPDRDTISRRLQLLLASLRLDTEVHHESFFGDMSGRGDLNVIIILCLFFFIIAKVDDLVRALTLIGRYSGILVLATLAEVSTYFENE